MVTFRTTSALELFRLVRGLNALLPSAVRVRDASYIDANFHPIRSATGKIYRYRIWRAVGTSPFVTPYVWQLTHPLNLPAMTVAAAAFVGTHDFTSFCATDSSAATKIRTLYDLRIVEKGPLLELWFCGEGFLKQMVRTLVGTIVAVGQGRLESDDMKRLLAEKNRTRVPATAPALGLCLVRVCYEEDTHAQFAALLDESNKGYNLRCRVNG